MTDEDKDKIQESFTNYLFGKSVPVSVHISDDVSSVGAPSNSIKLPRPKDLSVKSKFTSTTYKNNSPFKRNESFSYHYSMKVIEKSKPLSEATKRSSTNLGHVSESQPDAPLVESLRTIYPQIKHPGKLRKYSPNKSTEAFSVTKYYRDK